MRSDWRAVDCRRGIFVACIASLKKAGKMSEPSSQPLACLDANIFLAVLIPEATRAPKDEIAGSARVLKSVEEGRLRGVSTAILLGEIRYVYLRENKAGFEIARAAIEAESNLRVLTITPSLAIHAAELRRRYYSKRNAFSYNDGLYLATGLAERSDVLITTDPHLLSVADLKTLRPSQYR
jgi:predicted nucleic acid-binding protein